MPTIYETASSSIGSQRISSTSGVLPNGQQFQVGERIVVIGDGTEICIINKPGASGVFITSDGVNAAEAISSAIDAGSALAIIDDVTGDFVEMFNPVTEAELTNFLLAKDPSLVYDADTQTYADPNGLCPIITVCVETESIGGVLPMGSTSVSEFTQTSPTTFVGTHAAHDGEVRLTMPDDQWSLATSTVLSRSSGSTGTVNVEFTAPTTPSGFESGFRKWVQVDDIDNEGTGITTDAPLTTVTNMVEDPAGTVTIPTPSTGAGSVRSVTVNASTGNPSNNVIDEQTAYSILFNTSGADATTMRARMGIAEAVELTLLCGQIISAVSASGAVLTQAEIDTVVSKLPCPDGACFVGDSYNNDANEPAEQLNVAMPFDVDRSLAVGGAASWNAIPAIQGKIQNLGPLPSLGIWARGLNDIGGTTNQDPNVLMDEIDAAIQVMFANGSEQMIIATIPPYGEPLNGEINPGFTSIKPQIIIDTNVLIREYAAQRTNVYLWEVHDTLVDPTGTGWRNPIYTIADNNVHINNEGSAATGQVLIDLVRDNFFC